MGIQCKLLISNNGHPKTVRLMKESVGRISDGPSSHSLDQLKLGLKKAFEFRKQQRKTPGVPFRCVYSNGTPYFVLVCWIKHALLRL